MFDQSNPTQVKASNYIMGGVISSLPPDQWIIELKSWESTAWAAHQIALAEFATGAKAIDPQADNYTVQPSSIAEKQLCKSLKVRKPGGFV